MKINQMTAVLFYTNILNYINNNLKYYINISKKGSS